MKFWNNFDYNNICWWCGVKATTREHIFKKTDFELIFGKSNYQKGNEPVVTREGYYENRIIQSSDSKLIKFEHNLCQECNTSKSQNYDVSYSIFINYLFKKLPKLLSKPEINLDLVFESDWQIHKKNILAYIVKHICCRLAKSKIKIPQEYLNYLNGKDKLEKIFIKPGISSTLYKNLQDMRENNEGQGFIIMATLNEYNDDIGKYFFSSYLFNCINFFYLLCPTITTVNYKNIDRYNESKILHFEHYEIDNIENNSPKSVLINESNLRTKHFRKLMNLT